MKINIYYGGRGMIDDPTISVINRMTSVLEELRVNVERFNLYELKNNIMTLPQTLKEADAIILAATVEWFGIGGYMHSFLDAEELLEKMNDTNEAALQVRELNKNKSGITASINRVREIKSGLYRDMKDGLISDMDYAYLSKKYSEEQGVYESQAEDIAKKLELYKVKKDTDASVTIRKFMKSKKLSKTMVDAFISSIVVDNEGQFDVSMKLKDEYDELIRQLILREGDLANVG